MSLSVIIPCKSRLNHLISCIGTLLSQTVQPDEIIVVDYDCPEDTYNKINNLSIILGVDNIKAVRAETNSSYFNLSRSRNQGFIHSTCDLVFFCDADTILSDTFIEDHTKHYQKATFYCGWGASACTGNLICNREMIVRADGYNEDMQGWGFEDIAMYQRLEALGWRLLPFLGGCSNIEHSDTERTKHYQEKDKWKTNQQNSEYSQWTGLSASKQAQ